jgi:hypothetical protein
MQRNVRWSTGIQIAPRLYESMQRHPRGCQRWQVCAPLYRGEVQDEGNVAQIIKLIDNVAYE